MPPVGVGTLQVVLRVLLCEDGKSPYSTAAESINIQLQNILLGVEVIVQSFSFICDTDEETRLRLADLEWADLFYFVGVFEMSLALKHALGTSPLVDKLRERIQSM